MPPVIVIVRVCNGIWGKNGVNVTFGRETRVGFSTFSEKSLRSVAKCSKASVHRLFSLYIRMYELVGVRLLENRQLADSKSFGFVTVAQM